MDTNNTHYELYRDQCFDLAETLVFKSDYAAQFVNKELTGAASNHYDPQERRTWKYYMNLAGDYYPTDRRMYVQSLDTQEMIEFNRAELAQHRATARAYTYGTRLYYELLARYPNEESLILGILYPVPYERSIPAEEFEIVGYPPHLVQSNEYELIYQIQHFVQTQLDRWRIKGYQTYEEYYGISIAAMMYSVLEPLIEVTRLQYAKTPQAHSFHVRQYLASHMGLDQYFEAMTLEQQLWFYRNINWVMRNAGRLESFDELVQHIMNDRRLALASYRVTHDIEHILEELSPEALVRRDPLNRFVAASYQELLTIDDTLVKEDSLAQFNIQEREFEGAYIDFRFRNAISNITQTKVLESAMTDYADATPFPFSDVLMQHWPYLAAKGLYRAYVRITNPRTGDVIPLQVGDAYVFAQYLLTASQKIELDTVQPVICRKVQLDPFPSVEDILSMTSGRWFDRAFVQDLTRYNPSLSGIVSIDSFYERCRDIFTALQYQRGMTSWQEHWQRRGEVQGMSARCYGVQIVHLAPEGQSYQSWFAERQIDMGDFPVEQYELVYKDIVEQALGLNLQTVTSLKNLQRLMISMFQDLSSYSIQFVTEINDSPLKIMDWPVIRFGNYWAVGRTTAQFIDTTVNFWRFDGHGHHAIDHDLTKGFRIFNVDHRGRYRLRYWISRQWINTPRTLRLRRFLTTAPIKFSQRSERDTLYPDGTYPLPGISQTWLGLTEDQKRMLPDMYRDDWWPGDGYDTHA